MGHEHSHSCSLFYWEMSYGYFIPEFKSTGACGTNQQVCFRDLEEQILVRTWERAEGNGAGHQESLQSFIPVLTVVRDPLLCCLPFWALPGLWAVRLQAAFMTYSPVSHRIACRNPWPLVDPGHLGDDLTPHRVPEGPGKGCR